MLLTQVQTPGFTQHFRPVWLSQAGLPDYYHYIILMGFTDERNFKSMGKSSMGTESRLSRRGSAGAFHSLSLGSRGLNRLACRPPHGEDHWLRPDCICVAVVKAMSLISLDSRDHSDRTKPCHPAARFMADPLADWRYLSEWAAVVVSSVSIC